MFKWEILIVFVTFQKSSSSFGNTVTWVKVGKLVQWGMFYMFQVWVKQHPKEFFFVSFLLFPECRKESLLLKRNLRDSGSRTNVQFAVVPWHTFIQVLHDTQSCLWYLLALAVKVETKEWCNFCLVAQSFNWGMFTRCYYNKWVHFWGSWYNISCLGSLLVWTLDLP
jgi:hypothetical protein